MLLRWSRLPTTTPRLLCAAGAAVLCAVGAPAAGLAPKGLLLNTAAYRGGDSCELRQTRASSSHAGLNYVASSSTMAVVAEGKRVAVHYTGTLPDGVVFDSTEGLSPLEFDVGSGDTLKGIDAAVRGMVVGESKKVTLPPADGYGEYDPSKLQEVEVSRLPEGCEVGTPLQSGRQRFVVAQIANGIATLDANHEHAGKTLTFDILVLAITDPPEPFRSKPRFPAVFHPPLAVAAASLGPD